MSTGNSLSNRVYDFLLNSTAVIVQYAFHATVETRSICTLEFALHFLARMQVGEYWKLHILWTYESHFHLDGTLNRENFAYGYQFPCRSMSVETFSIRHSMVGNHGKFHFGPVILRGSYNERAHAARVLLKKA